MRSVDELEASYCQRIVEMVTQMAVDAVAERGIFRSSIQERLLENYVVILVYQVSAFKNSGFLDMYKGDSAWNFIIDGIKRDIGIQL